MTNRPPPLTPPDCDLRGFDYFPFMIGRFRSSDLVTEEEPEAILAAVLLWGAAWHEVPAASLPDNDRWLAKQAGYGRAVDAWLKVRDGALRGFVLCSDGRLYNRTLAEKAREAWESRLRHKWQQATDRHRKSQRDLPEAERTRFPDFDSWRSGARGDVSAGKDDLFRRNGGSDPPENADPPDGNPAENALKGREGKGRDRESKDSQANACVSSGADDEEEDEGQKPEPRAPRPDDFVEIWNEVARRIGRPAIATITVSRRQTLRARLAQFKPEDFQTVFAKVEASDFLAGRTPRWAGVTFDWLVKQANFLKVLEGNYDV